MSRATCKGCNRNIVLVRSGGELVAADPELMSVIPHQEQVRAGRLSAPVESARQTLAYRVHAPLCDSYREQARIARIADEQRAYNKKNGRAPRRNSGL